MTIGFARRRILDVHRRVALVLAPPTQPWCQWLALYAVLLPFFTLYRCVGLKAMLETFATPDERTSATKASAILLGFCEDALLITILLVLLSAVDWAVGPRSAWATMHPYINMKSSPTEDLQVISDCESRSAPPFTLRQYGSTAIRRLLRLVLHAALLVLAIVPFATDMLLLRIRNMRFTFEFVHMYLREINFTTDFAVDPYEVRLARETVAVALTVILLILLVNLMWLDFTRWHLAVLYQTYCQRLKPTVNAQKLDGVVYYPVKIEYSKLEVDDAVIDVGSHTTDDSTTHRDGSPPPSWRRVALVVLLPLALCSALSAVLLLVTHVIPAVASAAALNNSLNELFRTTTKLQFLHSLGDGTIASAQLYVDASSESYTLYQDDVLYRTTTGFKGPLAFDVAVNTSDPPNVLVLVVESFRYQDSLYLVGNNSHYKNITLTPHFDRWAQRGVAFRNMWSSWQTSRSLESILFGQVPYDHITDSGTSGGRRDVTLHGMPQFFKQKGYETLSTTGATITYDQWNKFLPDHGFDEVLSYAHFKKLAEETHHIKKNDWKGQHREFSWGVHDDLSLAVLGDLLINRTLAQQQRVARGEAKTPFFVNHYTISSHAPFRATPDWFETIDLPQFQPLYQGHPNEYDVYKYARIRYFTDLAIGTFLDRMKAQGVLDDTIVVVVGDHGQSPEESMSSPDVDQVATTRVAAALIAEGRLGKYAGLMVDDATEHTDLLNTLADITGVPSEGFQQSGVGRSLKRAVQSNTTRAVWTNNPKQTLAVVKGHERLRFDRVFSMMQLFDVENDPDEKHDLLPSVSEAERREWELLREQGRRLSRYFRVRWDKACISQIKC